MVHLIADVSRDVVSSVAVPQERKTQRHLVERQ
jgi:hypothetical protein